MNDTDNPGFYHDVWLLTRELTDDEKEELDTCQAAADAPSDNVDDNACYWNENVEKYTTDSHRFLAYRKIKYTSKTMTELKDIVTRIFYIKDRVVDGELEDETATEHDEFERYIFYVGE